MESNRTRRRRFIQVVFFAMAIGLALSISAIAAAQSTPIYQFGCWGLFSAGGGRAEIVQPDGSNYLYGSMGMWSAGIATNTDYIISSGHISPMAYGGEKAVTEGTETGGPPSLYLPFVGNFVEVIYVCPY